jgi:hypothetical protein
MDENGMYAGWYDFTVTVRPSLAFGLDMSIHGKRHASLPDGTLDYLYEVYQNALTQEVDITSLCD